MSQGRDPHPAVPPWVSPAAPTLGAAAACAGRGRALPSPGCEGDRGLGWPRVAFGVPPPPQQSHCPCATRGKSRGVNESRQESRRGEQEIPLTAPGLAMNRGFDCPQLPPAWGSWGPVVPGSRLQCQRGEGDLVSPTGVTEGGTEPCPWGRRCCSHRSLGHTSTHQLRLQSQREMRWRKARSGLSPGGSWPRCWAHASPRQLG